uniref:Ig-like domain-containing protein n=1 Tax=Xenopus tropicalis TaxID=8364 RepID=A0A1B8Y6X4_XENTR
MRRYMHLKWTILMVVLEGGFPGSYSQDWAITLPESIRALRGSCVVIPCAFTRPRGNKDFSLVWYNEDSFPDKIIFSQQDPSDVSEGYRHRTSLVGNEPNSCSLRINGVQESETYYPYINGNCNIFSDICQTVRVQVSDDPNVPVIKMPSILTEGKRAFISCSVEHTCPPRPPTLQWNRAGYKLTDRQQSLKDGVWKAETVMGYLPSYRDHGAELECKATYPNGLRSQRRVTLNIRYSPKNTVIIISDGKKERKEGDAVSLICASDANPAANAFTWYNNKRDGTVELREEQGRSITVTVGRGRETFSCTARNPLGTGNSTLSELQVFLEVLGQQLKKVTFSGQQLKKVTFSGQQLKKITFSGEPIEKNHIFGEPIEKSHIFGAAIEKSHIFGAAIEKNHIFGGNQLKKVTFSGQQLKKVTFSGRQLKKVTFSRGN